MVVQFRSQAEVDERKRRLMGLIRNHQERELEYLNEARRATRRANREREKMRQHVSEYNTLVSLCGSEHRRERLDMVEVVHTERVGLEAEAIGAEVGRHLDERVG